MGGTDDEMSEGTVRSAALTVAAEIEQAMGLIGEEEAMRLVEAIEAARGVFCTGQGRSGLMIKAFAMRLVHLGLNAWAVGEVTTPAIGPRDLLVAASGSGETRTTLAIMQAAQERGAQTSAITAHPASPVARAADLVLEIRTPITGPAGPRASAQPPGSLFEQALLTVCDALVMVLMRRLGTTEEEMRARHTKLE